MVIQGEGRQAGRRAFQGPSLHTKVFFLFQSLFCSLDRADPQQVLSERLIVLVNLGSSCSLT